MIDFLPLVDRARRSEVSASMAVSMQVMRCGGRDRPVLGQSVEISEGPPAGAADFLTDRRGAPSKDERGRNGHRASYVEAKLEGVKADRLLSILLLLQTRGRVAASELAERLEVSPRTIYRDVEALSAAGVPVYAERGRNGGIALLPGFRTDVTGLTSDEARALFVLTAQGTHAALGLDGALGSALRKVMAALPAPHRPAAELTSRRILVDPDRWMSGPRTAVDLDTLHTAVFTDCRLRIRYRHSGATRPRTYTVDPYGLVAKAGSGTWSPTRKAHRGCSAPKGSRKRP